MANDEVGGTDRDELLQRLELMETMIAEGRRATCRHGWIFILWGLVDLIGMGWQSLQPHSRWVWWICGGGGLALNVLGVRLRKNGQGQSSGIERSVTAVWRWMGVTMVLYVASVLLTHFGWQYSYLSALLMMLGMAHAISAAILRWRVQALIAAVWWAGGMAILFSNSHKAAQTIFLAEMCLGMIAFGIYATIQERRFGGWVRNV
jgi:hypothetical protein